LNAFKKARQAAALLPPILGMAEIYQTAKTLWKRVEPDVEKADTLLEPHSEAQRASLVLLQEHGRTQQQAKALFCFELVICGERLSVREWTNPSKAEQLARLLGNIPAR
jgi:hypothetical protein